MVMEIEALGNAYPEMVTQFNLLVLAVKLICFQHSVDFIHGEGRFIPNCPFNC